MHLSVRALQLAVSLELVSAFAPLFSSRNLLSRQDGASRPLLAAYVEPDGDHPVAAPLRRLPSDLQESSLQQEWPAKKGYRIGKPLVAGGSSISGAGSSDGVGTTNIWSGNAATIVLDKVSKAFGRGNLDLFFPSERASALSEVSLELRGGCGVVAVVGDSGSGKSTLLKIIHGSEKPTSGSITVDGVRARVYLTRTFEVPHRSKPLDHNLRTIAEAGIAMAGAKNNAVAAIAEPGQGARATDIDVEAAVADILRMTGLTKRAATPPRDLSGSEVLLLGLAASLARGVWAPDPPLLLLDEYLDREDARVRQRVEGVMERLTAEEAIRIVSCTHCMEHALGCADAVVVMSGGKCVQADRPDQTAYIRAYYDRMGAAAAAAVALKHSGAVAHAFGLGG